MGTNRNCFLINEKILLRMTQKLKRKRTGIIAFLSFLLVPVVGLEPTRCRHQRILSPPRLPFQHTGIFNFCTAMDEIPNIGGISKC